MMKHIEVSQTLILMINIKAAIATCTAFQKEIGSILILISLGILIYQLLNKLWISLSLTQ